MRKPEPTSCWYFVDESGDVNFYDKKGRSIVGTPGCSKILILGYIETTDPQPLRQAVLQLQSQLVNDPYFQKFPSIAKTAIAFHAKNDYHEVRQLFFDLMAKLKFRSQFVVARKREDIFKNQYQGRPNVFYDDLISKLFQNVLHRSLHNHIYFAMRGSRTRQVPISQAIEKGTKRFVNKWGSPGEISISIQPQTPSGEPCLSIIDYMNWAVYRAFIYRDMTYYNMVNDKVSFLVDLYDFKNYPRNW